MTLLIVCALAVILNGQEEYVPQVQAAQMNVERSQVYLDGEGYKLDQQQDCYRHLPELMGYVPDRDKYVI